MSIISNRHQVSAFIAGTSKALSGQRLARVGYKSTKNAPAKYPSVCASVPVLTAECLTPDTLTKLQPHILVMLQDAQDGVLRSLYESSDGTLTTVSDDDISVDACIGYLSAVAAGGRLTAELVAAWFDNQVAENLTVVLAEKLGFQELNTEQLKTIGKHLNGYKALMAECAAWTDKKARMTDKQINGIRRALDVASIDDDVSGKLLAKLDAMEKKEDYASIL